MGDDDITKETIEQLVSNLPEKQRERYERLWTDLMTGTRTGLSVKPYVRYHEVGSVDVAATAGALSHGLLDNALSGGVVAGISTDLSREELARQLALLREAQEHPLYPHAEPPQWPAEYLDGDDSREGDMKYDTYHFPSGSGRSPKAAAKMSAEDTAKWVRPSYSSSVCLKCGVPLPDDKLYRCDACDNILRNQERLAGLLPTALSLVLRMARGYDWRPDEVDAFEAACKAAGIEVEPPTEKSADTDREL